MMDYQSFNNLVCMVNWMAILMGTLHMCAAKQTKDKSAKVLKLPPPPPTPSSSSFAPSSAPPAQFPLASSEPVPEDRKEEEITEKEEQKEEKSLNFKPIIPKYTAKEQAIADGERKKRTEYATMDDICSDWDDGEKKNKKETEEKGAEPAVEGRREVEL
ncbi:unnamed protein product [Caenorhabditis sp. 36 PRJEB53466]|nr:unnamed protein product [Caenorhabditis sp. 36 PRJEB53466]